VDVNAKIAGTVLLEEVTEQRYKECLPYQGKVGGIRGPEGVRVRVRGAVGVLRSAGG
jgi:hypothetical protein